MDSLKFFYSTLAIGLLLSLVLISFFTKSNSMSVLGMNYICLIQYATSKYGHTVEHDVFENALC